jgi:ElaB/YqjD/DUF883 family membrane-anchored ribosome-binding protein
MTLLANSNELNSKKPPFTNSENKDHSLSHRIGKDTGEFVGNASQKASEYVEHTRHYVKDNPIKGIAFAAIAGAAMGVVVTMASRRSR